MTDWNQLSRAQITEESTAILRDWHLPRDGNDRDWVHSVQIPTNIMNRSEMNLICVPCLREASGSIDIINGRIQANPNPDPDSGPGYICMACNGETPCDYCLEFGFSVGECVLPTERIAMACYAFQYVEKCLQVLTRTGGWNTSNPLWKFKQLLLAWLQQEYH